LNKKLLGSGSGKSKKESEQQALKLENAEFI
jgi:dsRNA-specific ribonuclease